MIFPFENPDTVQSTTEAYNFLNDVDLYESNRLFEEEIYKLNILFLFCKLIFFSFNSYQKFPVYCETIRSKCLAVLVYDLFLYIGR